MKTYKIDTYLRRKDALPIWSEHIGNRIRREPDHTHNCMEIMYIRSGAACCKVNHCLYPVTRGDFFVFAPGDVHAFSISGELCFDNLLFSLDLFSCEELKKLQEYRIFDSWCKPGDFSEKKLSFPISSAVQLDAAFDELNRVCQENAPENDMLLKALLIRLLFMALRQRKQPGLLPETQHAMQLSSLLEFIAEHYAEELTVADLAKIIDVSPNYLNEYMHRTIGQGAMEYVLRCRVDQARNALEHSKKSVAEIAADSGFYDASHLIRIFRQYTGVTPGKYRKLFENT